ncbi:hypothetical protein CWB41_14080 [Methylovirgula ligni]|uniref:Soluble lytic murein transglycosylase-like protein n=1 Tax=Methylovirgula ligni TaxID=569860 RepID=A0A3D9YKY3_9HYPH|nr:transglycosylase SLT domain-containing protein [Methylovirgula ligni]QAY96722.1 hypothetical protein CWB41_14080 [Methylovirgula ligni]REF83237.1 soluble lytic murein transglycosylase-like protein [Methylovirgula ligni]
MIFEPSRHGATARAYVMAALLALVTLLILAPHAHAASRHHHWHHHWHHHHARHHHARHHHHRHAGVAHHRHRAAIAIDVKTGAVEPVRDPFSFLAGSLFRAPAPAALVFDHEVIRPAVRAIEGAARFASAGYVIVARRARDIGVPLPLAMSLTVQESGGNCHAHGPPDGRGVLQVEPGTARKDGFDPRKLFDCDYGAVAGLTEMKHLLDAEGGVTCRAISLYNGSEGYVDRRGGCTRYGRQVLARARKLEAIPDFEALVLQADWRPHGWHARRWHWRA